MTAVAGKEVFRTLLTRALTLSKREAPAAELVGPVVFVPLNDVRFDGITFLSAPIVMNAEEDPEQDG